MFFFIHSHWNWDLFCPRKTWPFEFKSHLCNSMVIMNPMGNEFEMSQTYRIEVMKEIRNFFLLNFWEKKKNYSKSLRALILKQSGIRMHLDNFPQFFFRLYISVFLILAIHRDCADKYSFISDTYFEGKKGEKKSKSYLARGL